MCSLEGCDRRHFSHGWCRLHYTRWKKHGDPHTARPPGRFPAPRVWPIEPLIAITTSDERLHIGLNGTTLAGERLTDREADTAATRLGLHPSLIWPGWFDPYWPADLDLADPGWLEVCALFDRSSERRRVAAEDWTAWLWGSQERTAA